MLTARNINKHFLLNNEKIRVLRDISLDIAPGDFLSITGRSGSGKTTLLNVLSTLVQANTGELHYDEHDLSALSPAMLNELRQRDFAVIFQFHHLLPYLTVLQNALLPFMRSMVPVPREIVDKAEACLEQIGLQDKLDRLPGNLSGGEQQRVAIARAMVKSAKILFADEPTGSLDRRTGEDIMNLLEELHHDGLTVVMVTHEQVYAERAARQLELSDGAVLHEAHLEKSHFQDTLCNEKITGDSRNERSEFCSAAHNENIADTLDAGFYFAHPCASWQRGLKLNENTNGLIRQYFPKNRNFAAITQEEINKAMHKLNNRPRKCLGITTLNHVFLGTDPPVALAG